MATPRGRWLELTASFLLGGGVVALVYEWRSPATADATGGVAVAPPTATASSPVTAPSGDPPPSYATAPAEAADDGSVEGGATDDGATTAAVGDKPEHFRLDETGSYLAFPGVEVPPPAMTPEDESEYPRHGLVTSAAVIVRARAELTAPIHGILRGGTRIRVDAERSFGGGCSQGWHRVFPRGWICLAAGVTTGTEPPQAEVNAVVPDLAGTMPYEYWRVNADATPFFHRLPSFGEQEQADAAGAAWLAENGRAPMPTSPADRPPEVPAVVKEYMNAGFYVTKAGEEIKSERRFIRTTRGSYARKYQLGQKEAAKFRGKLVDETQPLPIHFIRREMPLMKREAANSDVLVKTDTVPPRLGTWKFVRKLHVGTVEYFEDADGNLMRAYAVGEAHKIKRPPGIGPDDKWVHVDLSEQTLVAYVGDVPVFATLVSTGKTPGMTPVGVHRVQIKHIATSMRDQPIEDEAYSIDDVPWTQYFAGSVALHGAFWHAGFGIERSHGCVNLSTSDARWLFGFTEPQVPTGWQAIAPSGSAKGSAVVVTE
jgi:lipoprotein-anchoring transpeptidase ErfK/SrfK